MITSMRWGVVLAVLLLAGCSGPVPAEPAAPESAASSTEAIPVIDRNFADPDILRVGDTYYAYATNDNSLNVQVAESSDLKTWQLLAADALPDLPSWIIPGKTWAPEVTEVSPGNYVMYFTAANFQPALQCIGVATGANPTGPFVVQGDGMVVCPEDEGGAIDATTFVDNGVLNLVWKNDGNCCGLDTWIQTAPLSANGRSLAGPIQKLIKQTLSWEGNLVEAPTLIKHDSSYILLYSSNSYADDRYAIGYASAPSLAGPWTKNDDPFLSTDSSGQRYLGPGGQDVIAAADGTDYLVFHGWDSAYTYRAMYVVPIEWDGSVPHPVLDE